MQPPVNRLSGIALNRFFQSKEAKRNPPFFNVVATTIGPAGIDSLARTYTIWAVMVNPLE